MALLRAFPCNGTLQLAVSGESDRGALVEAVSGEIPSDGVFIEREVESVVCRSAMPLSERAGRADA
jgi:hypothetical protein